LNVLFPGFVVLILITKALRAWCQPTLAATGFAFPVRIVQIAEIMLPAV
jgi:hypothetical protein